MVQHKCRRHTLRSNWYWSLHYEKQSCWKSEQLTLKGCYVVTPTNKSNRNQNIHKVFRGNLRTWIKEKSKFTQKIDNIKHTCNIAIQEPYSTATAALPLLPHDWNGDLSLSKWGPNGDSVLSEMGTKWGPSAAEMGTKWGPKKRIFDKLTEMS